MANRGKKGGRGKRSKRPGGCRYRRRRRKAPEPEVAHPPGGEEAVLGLRWPRGSATAAGRGAEAGASAWCGGCRGAGTCPGSAAPARFHASPYLGWVLKTKTYFSRNSPVLLLGKCYHFKYEDENKLLPARSGCTIEDHIIAGNVEEFRKDFTSRIWLTYREEFPQIEGSTLTTDCGWGCTLRTGQMLLAQGLILHFLGRAWTWPDALNIENSDFESWTSNTVKKFTASFEASLSEERELKTPTISLKETIGRYSDDHEMRNEIYHRKIISWFGDSPLALFGLHQLIEYGKKSGKKAGDWYGPAVVAHILRKAVEEARHPDLQGITIYVAQDCTVYSSDVIDKQCASMASDHADDKAVIILVPVRLGGERTNTDYLDFVKGILSLEYCVGIIGGKPKQSYYFAGFQDDSLIYMDPHYCQSFVDVSIKDFPLETFHCPSPKKMSFRKMDPSCTIGFYCRNVQDFKRASEEITKVQDLAKCVWAVSIPSPLSQEEARKNLPWVLGDRVSSLTGSGTSGTSLTGLCLHAPSVEGDALTPGHVAEEGTWNKNV
ncbi:cysteine protease ATG4C isoform X1 [Equus quagga]|uniref:cysteine protease ATG4C isoform X1 n=1 Tax=Equus quagga TaxID=89248 RepID=UPI001EE2DC65|nr:cysteine protease ATG4C isoform X1 [Equus quagga]